MIIRLIIMAFIGCLIGWITNRVAIKMLFKPVKPIKFLFFTIQGVMPKRQNELAKSIGEIVANEFVSISELIEKMATISDIEKIKAEMKEKLSVKAKEIIPPMFLAMAGDQIMSMIDTLIDTEGEKFLRQFLKDIENKAQHNIDISKMVEDKINSLDFGEFEEIVLKITKKELKHIEYIGAVLGFVIGLIQGIISIFI